MEHVSPDPVRSEARILLRAPRGRAHARLVGLAAIALCAIGLEPLGQVVNSERPAGVGHDVAAMLSTFMAAALVRLSTIVLTCCRLSARRFLVCAIWEACLAVMAWWMLGAHLIAALASGDEVPTTHWCLAASAILGIYVFGWAWLALRGSDSLAE